MHCSPFGNSLRYCLACVSLACLLGDSFVPASPVAAETPATLPGTEALTLEGDIASTMIDGIDRFLLRETEQAVKVRGNLWSPFPSTNKSKAVEVGPRAEPSREHFARMIGVRDPRIEPVRLELTSNPLHPGPLATGAGYEIYNARWPVLEGVEGEGLVARPKGDAAPRAVVICLPDASQTPEALFGLTPGVPEKSQIARRLAENGCLVIVPMLIDRGTELSATMNGAKKLDVTHREFLYRAAFDLGRHIIGYEVQKVLALADWHQAQQLHRQKSTPLAVIGHGDGGQIALYAGAIDRRLEVVGVSGYFASRQNLWQEPLDRNVFGLIKWFGDAELVRFIDAGRSLLIEACAAPEMTIAPGGKGGPGRIVTPDNDDVRAEFARAQKQLPPPLAHTRIELIETEPAGRGPMGSDAFLTSFLEACEQTEKPEFKLAAPGKIPQLSAKGPSTGHLRQQQQERLARQFKQIEAHTQRLIVESPYVRAEFMKKANRDSRDPQAYSASVEPYRDYFRREVIGEFEQPLSEPKPRSRLFQEHDKYTIYEVVLDVFPDVIAYGLYIVPKGIKPGEQRPVVVCQHGLEGRPQDVIGEQGFNYYKAFATQLAERGFITFAPQNIYIFKDRFRTLQRKANPIGKSLFSIMVPQHEQIVRWLATQPQVDAKRIGFYGLSYGGKSAMRIPALVEGYALSICSADFNEWVWKNASTRSQYTYVGTGEYEIFEFDLGSTFNYAEMAALICPRPFMVERGHRDGVGPDDMVSAEYAKVRLLYVDLKIPEWTEIEYFDGPHSINGQATFEFLHRHLNLPKPQ